MGFGELTCNLSHWVWSNHAIDRENIPVKATRGAFVNSFMFEDGRCGQVNFSPSKLALVLERKRHRAGVVPVDKRHPGRQELHGNRRFGEERVYIRPPQYQFEASD